MSLLCLAKPHESRRNKAIQSNFCWPGFGRISEILSVCIRCLLRRICTFITKAHIFPPLHTKASGFLLTLFRSGFSGAERSSSSFSTPSRCKMESFNRGARNCKKKKTCQLFVHIHNYQVDLSKRFFLSGLSCLKPFAASYHCTFVLFSFLPYAYFPFSFLAFYQHLLNAAFFETEISTVWGKMIIKTFLKCRQPFISVQCLFQKLSEDSIV